MRHAPQWGAAVDERLLARAADLAFAMGGGDSSLAEVSLLLADDAEIRDLNRTWRGRDEPTNVLSFPLDAPHRGVAPRPLGDIVLAYGTVAREAAARGVPVCQHAAHLVVHGMLHLLGHDHENEAQARDMEALEVRVLARLGLPDPYEPELMTSGDSQ
jgi:probable rRNA maturation factor